MFSRVRVFWFKHGDFAVRSARVDMRIEELLTVELRHSVSALPAIYRAKICAPRTLVHVEIAVPDLTDHLPLHPYRHRHDAPSKRVGRAISTLGAQSNHLAPVRAKGAAAGSAASMKISAVESAPAL